MRSTRSWSWGSPRRAGSSLSLALQPVSEVSRLLFLSVRAQVDAEQALRPSNALLEHASPELRMGRTGRPRSVATAAAGDRLAGPAAGSGAGQDSKHDI